MNSASLILERPDELHLKLIQRRGTARPSKVKEMTQALHAMDQAIKQHWNDAPPDVQAAFREMAHMLENPPRPRIRDWIRFVAMSVLAGPDEVKGFHEAILTLEETLRGIIERENRAVEALIQEDDVRASIDNGWKDDTDLMSSQEALECIG